MPVNCKEYDFPAIEAHWQDCWGKEKIFTAADFADKPKYYILDMFPYPSGAGLHAGHAENFVGSDILGRFHMARGFNVMHPMGWDAFGLPAEQYAVKTGTHPSITTRNNIANFTAQIKRLGLAIDWSREINTTDPSYFRWTQWIFLQLFHRGLAYVDERPVNWCPALGTVLANEEVIDGKSEVGGHPVERRRLRQWVLRITAYADRLVEGLRELNWPDSTKTMQVNWIGRSTGAKVRFPVADSDDTIEVFTTRPDTLFGATYMVLAPEHSLVPSLTTEAQREAVEAYVAQAARKSDLDRTDLAKTKTGVFTGSFALNPVNNERIPVWVADYVLASYGTGAIMAVPGQDERDWEFAEQFDLPIIRTVQPPDAWEGKAYLGDGPAINSQFLDGLHVAEAKARIIAWLEEHQLGTATVNYKLRDWLFSRQRYWGEPFPIVWVETDAYEAARRSDTAVSALMPEDPIFYEDESGKVFYALPLPESRLPLELPEAEDYKPSGDGESPLAKVQDWVNIWFHVESGESRPRSGDDSPGENWFPARRETNTMPQWAGSCWYYLRYIDPHNDRELIDEDKRDYWGVPDIYVGGAEHAVLHLLYARFWHKFLVDIGVLEETEPFRRLFHQGIILGEDGEKMSKSRGNVVNPDQFIESHGSDSFRTYLMFMGPYEDMKPWNTQGIEGVYRFYKKVWRELMGDSGTVSSKVVDAEVDSVETRKLLHQTIRKVTEDIITLKFNTAISQMMILMNHLAKEEKISMESARSLCSLLAPFAPHLAEEIWARLGGTGSVAFASWPEYDPQVLIEDEVQIGLLVNGKPRGEIMVPKTATQEAVMEIAMKQPRFAAHVEGKTIRKLIYVPEKILNVVAN